MTRLLVRLSVWCYWIALVRYPRSLRRRYGRDMLESFESLAIELVAKRGFRGLIEVWWRCGLDLARPLPSRPHRIPGGDSENESVHTMHEGRMSRRVAGWRTSDSPGARSAEIERSG